MNDSAQQWAWPEIPLGSKPIADNGKERRLARCLPVFLVRIAQEIEGLIFQGDGHAVPRREEQAPSSDGALADRCAAVRQRKVCNTPACASRAPSRQQIPAIRIPVAQRGDCRRIASGHPVLSNPSGHATNARGPCRYAWGRCRRPTKLSRETCPAAEQRSTFGGPESHHGRSAWCCGRRSVGLSHGTACAIHV